MIRVNQNTLLQSVVCAMRGSSATTTTTSSLVKLPIEREGERRRRKATQHVSYSFRLTVVRASKPPHH